MFRSLITFTAICMTVLLAAPVQNPIDLSNPCFVLAEQSPSPSNGVSLSRSIADLILRTAGLKIQAQNIQEYLVGINEMDNTTVEGLKNYKGWMDDEEFVATVELKLAAIEKKIEALKSHFHLLAEHLIYINKARTDGQIAEISSEAETRQKLQDYETKLQSVMCSLKIAILSDGNDVTTSVSDNDLDPLFLLLNSPLENDTHRTYIAVHDGVKLMDFFSAIYKEIALSLNDTEA